MSLEEVRCKPVSDLTEKEREELMRVIRPREFPLLAWLADELSSGAIERFKATRWNIQQQLATLEGITLGDPDPAPLVRSAIEMRRKWLQELDDLEQRVLVEIYYLRKDRKGARPVLL